MDKEQFRAYARSLPGPDKTEADEVVAGLHGWLSGRLPGTIAAYLAMGSEVDVEPLFELLPGWRWVLVRVESDESVSFRDRAVAREVHSLGMRQPIAGGEAIQQHEIDVYLVPGLGFDETGSRIGRGRGFYDRILASRRADSVAVGVTVDSFVVDTVPIDEHDRRVDYLSTESGVRECSPKN